MRDRETIDSELRRITLMRRSLREQGHQPSCRQVDELLDERLALRTGAPETEAGEASAADVVADTLLQCAETDNIRRYGRKLRRFGSLAALPLSVATTATLLVVTFEANHPYSTAQPPVIPPSAEPVNPAAQPTVLAPSAEPINAAAQPTVLAPSAEPINAAAQPTVVPPSAKPSNPAAPRAPAPQRAPIPPPDILEGAFIDGLNQYGAASPDEMQQAIQNALSGLQAIPGFLQTIPGLPPIPGPQ